MHSLFCIIGKSGAGKDTVYSRVLALGLKGLSPVVPCTTRPKRVGETEGETYNFMTDVEMLECERRGEIVEKRSYSTVRGVWHYFTLDIDFSADRIMIATPEAVMKLYERYGRERVRVISITLGERERLERCIAREAGQEKPNYAEVCRRYLADEADFSEERMAEISCDFTADNSADAESCAKKIAEYINSIRQ